MVLQGLQAYFSKEKVRTEVFFVNFYIFLNGVLFLSIWFQNGVKIVDSTWGVLKSVFKIFNVFKKVLSYQTISFNFSRDLKSFFVRKTYIFLNFGFDFFCSCYFVP